MADKVEICSHCKDEICEFNENEHYRLNFKMYCSIHCYVQSLTEKVIKKNEKVRNKRRK